MGIVISSTTVAGTACPWVKGSASSNINGSSGIIVPYNNPNYDGTAAGGGTSGQNSAYLYGKLHTHSGETSPTVIAVTPGDLIIVEYVSGTVATGGGGCCDQSHSLSCFTSIPYLLTFYASIQ